MPEVISVKKSQNIPMYRKDHDHPFATKLNMGAQSAPRFDIPKFQCFLNFSGLFSEFITHIGAEHPSVPNPLPQISCYFAYLMFMN